MRRLVGNAVKLLRRHPVGDVHKRFDVGVLISDFCQLFVFPIYEDVFGSRFKSRFCDYTGKIIALDGGVDDENLSLLQVHAYFYCKTRKLFLFFDA